MNVNALARSCVLFLLCTICVPLIAQQPPNRQPPRGRSGPEGKPPTTAKSNPTTGARQDQRRQTIGRLGRPGAAVWRQFHADGPNQGSIWVGTDWAIEPKWVTEVGSGLFASPVIGPDGTIYIGNMLGYLFAIDAADGSLKWKRNMFGCVAASAAVSENGNIYVVSSEKVDDTSFRSTLRALDAAGNLRWSYRLPEDGFTTASPKVWQSGQQEYVFQFAKTGPRANNYALFVFDQTGRLVADERVGCTKPVTGGTDWGGLWDSIADVFEVLWDVLGGDGSFGIEFDTSGKAPSLYQTYGWTDPTVCVVDFPHVVPSGRALVVFADRSCHIYAYEFAPPNLTKLWFKKIKSPTSSPMYVDSARAIVYGNADGIVQARDIFTGDKKWTYKAKEPVMGTPASLGGLVYVASLRRLQVLDAANGDVIWKQTLARSTLASPAMSATHVYVSFRTGFQTFSFDLKSTFIDGKANGGLSSPSIGNDGAVYVVSPQGRTAFLRAYGTRGSAARIRLVPTALTIPRGGTVRLTATVTGVSDTRVEWNLVSGKGKLVRDASDPPNEVSYRGPRKKNTTAMITATSVADPVASAKATIMVVGPEVP